MAAFDVNGNDITSPETSLGYTRVFTDLTNTLTFERKEMTTSGESASTTRLLVELPNSYNVEVRFSASSGKFAIFRKSSGGTITQLRDYNWWSYRYSGDKSYTYYACIKFITGGTITPEDGEIIIRVLQYRDIGARHFGRVPSSLYGKKIAAIGDSIVQGRFCKNGQTVNESMLKPWSALISEKAACENANFGVGGGLIYNNDEKSISRSCADVTGFDAVILCGGTNDYGGNVSSANFSSAFTYIVETLMAHNTRLIVATPTVRTDRTAANTQGLTLADYGQIEKTIAEGKGVQVIDLRTLTNRDDFKAHLSDGLHPDEVGHFIISEIILENA